MKILDQYELEVRIRELEEDRDRWLQIACQSMQDRGVCPKTDCLIKEDLDLEDG